MQGFMCTNRLKILKKHFVPNNGVKSGWRLFKREPFELNALLKKRERFVIGEVFSVLCWDYGASMEFRKCPSFDIGVDCAPFINDKKSFFGADLFESVYRTFSEKTQWSLVAGWFTSFLQLMIQCSRCWIWKKPTRFVCIVYVPSLMCGGSLAGIRAGKVHRAFFIKKSVFRAQCNHTVFAEPNY